MLEYSQLARLGKHGWIRQILSLLIILFFWFIIGGAIFSIINATLPNTLLMNYISLNLSFIPLLIGIYLSIVFLHKREFITVITPYKRFNWTRLFWGFGVFLGLTSVSSLIEFFVYPGDFSFTLDFSTFFILLPFVIILTPIQAATEELFFRGYLIQSFGLLLNNKIILAILSGIIFLIPHLWNPELIYGFYLLITFYFLIGLLFAVVTLISNSLEVAMGAHIANNLFTALIVNYNNSALTTNSVFVLNGKHILFELLEFVVAGFIFFYLLWKYIGKEKKILEDTAIKGLEVDMKSE